MYSADRKLYDYKWRVDFLITPLITSELEASQVCLMTVKYKALFNEPLHMPVKVSVSFQAQFFTHGSPYSSTQTKPFTVCSHAKLSNSLFSFSGECLQRSGKWTARLRAASQHGAFCVFRLCNQYPSGFVLHDRHRDELKSLFRSRCDSERKLHYSFLYNKSVINIEGKTDTTGIQENNCCKRQRQSASDQNKWFN